MQKTSVLTLSALVLGGFLAGGCGSSTNGGADLAAMVDMATPPAADLATAAPDMSQSTMSFFITSRTGGGNLGGLAGADTICQTLATAAGHGAKVWAAYLSASIPATNARDRIGQGPWYNAAGVKIASNLAELHSPQANFTKAVGLDEKGVQVMGSGDATNEHDILTGSMENGTANGTNNCVNWTSAGAGPVATAAVGHFDKMGGGTNGWNFAHNVTTGCSDANLRATGGAGRFYCFAK